MFFSTLKVSLALLVVGVIGWFGYSWWSQEKKREMTSFMYELSTKATKDFSRNVPRVQNVETLLVLPVIGGRDEDTLLQNMLIDKIANSRKYSVRTWSDCKKDLNNGNLWQQLLKQAGFLQERMPTNKAEVQKVLEIFSKANYQVDGVLLVKCFYQEEEGILNSVVRLDGEILRYSESSLIGGSRLIEQNKKIKGFASIDSFWDHLFLTSEIYSYGYAARFLAWLILSFGPVWVFYPVSFWVLKKKNNVYNGLYLSLIILVGVLSSWVFLSAFAHISLSVVIFHIFLTGGLYWVNYDALDFLSKKT